MAAEALSSKGGEAPRGPARHETLAPKVLVILDLNGTLVHDHDKTLGGIERREGLDVLWDYLAMRVGEGLIRVGVWTSRQRTEARRMLAGALHGRGEGTVPHFMFSFDHGQCTANDSRTGVVYKNLDHVWQLFPAFDLHNTILVDDSPHKLLYSQYDAYYPVPSMSSFGCPASAAGASMSSSATSPGPDTALLDLVGHIEGRLHLSMLA
jgi:hypothetical protein